jgi:hypothetical protein
MRVLVRTVWFAGLLLALLLSLLVVKMIFGAADNAASDESLNDATAALAQVIPGENTLTDADRSVAAPSADDAALLPVESSVVRSARAEYLPSEIMHKHPRSPAKAVAKPRMVGSKPTTAVDAPSCRQLDPIARFLIQANIAPPCAG